MLVYDIPKKGPTIYDLHQASDEDIFLKTAI